MTKDFHFVSKPLLGIRAPKSLIDPTIVTDADGGP
jgi:hypothetical protein